MLNFLNGTVSNQIYFVYGLIGIVLALIVLILVLDRREKKRYRSKNLFDNKFIKKQKGLEPRASEVELKPLKSQETVVEEVAPVPLPVEAVEVPEVPSVVEKEAVEEIVYASEDPELEKTQAQLELQRLTEELKKQEAEDKNIKLTNFELEQEENAIISIHELMEKSNELYDKNDEVQYMDEGNEPINLEELQAKFQSSNGTVEVENIPSLEVSESSVVAIEPAKEVMLEEFAPVLEKEQKEKTPSKFKSTPFISPIYGVEKEEAKVSTVELKKEVVPSSLLHEDQIQLEQTADLDQLDEEIRKTNEFLQVLKELQKNLE